MTEATNEPEFTTLDQHAPAPPSIGEVTTLDQHAPAPPALDRDGQ